MLGGDGARYLALRSCRASRSMSPFSALVLTAVGSSLSGVAVLTTSGSRLDESRAMEQSAHGREGWR